MTEYDIRGLLVIGVDIVSLATSAAQAGYRIYAVDYFGDLDLERVCQESLSIINQTPGITCGQLGTGFDPEGLLQLAKRLLKKNVIDATLLSAGLDDSSDVLFELHDVAPILGNPPHVIDRIRDKTDFFQELNRLRIPHPWTAMASDLGEARKKAKDIGYPILVKPSMGFAGAGIRKAQNPQELKPAYHDASKSSEKVLIQEYIPGTPASVSLISSISKTTTLTLNEQLLGVSEVGQEEPFGYCGNIVPLKAATLVMNRCESIAKTISRHFSLIGSNGIDLIISKEGIPHVIEVNPRFQGTLECVERVLGINMVKTHMRSCLQSILPTTMKKTKVFCSRLILFAPQRSVAPNLSPFKEVRDMPMPGVIIEKGEPICSIMTEGPNRESSSGEAMITAEKIRKLLQPKR